ncbi:Glycerophosphodiester phosphodiesterase [Bertholletia excelsa]
MPEIARCHKQQGPIIRFPFRLKGQQPEHCGYPHPAFHLSCIENSTVFELASTLKLVVKEIDYPNQLLYTLSPDDSLTRLPPNLTLYLSNHNSHFQLAEDEDNSDYSFFSCSSTNSAGYIPVTCLNPDPSRKIYAVPSGYYISFNPLLSCKKINTIPSVPWKILDPQYGLPLHWSRPDCRNCELKNNMRCGLKKYSPEPETECFRISKFPIGLLRGLVLLPIVLIAVYCGIKFIMIKRDDSAKINGFLRDYKALKPARYSYDDIKKITNQFKEKIGQGGCGAVYKGKLSSDVRVAVKILDNAKGNGDDFINEVGIIGRIHHINVVRLVGYCADGYRRALIYEFLPNKSLEKFISSDHERHLLGWEKLQQIALGIAKGIEYLHLGCDQRILHFDIKPHNILLDNKFNPKISDFGLAKLCSREQSAVSMTAVRGTVGYIAPEVFSRNFGSVSYKSDVYSFGMLLLDLVGRRNNNEAPSTSLSYFPDWIYKSLDKGKDLEIQLGDDNDAKIIEKLTIVGLWCIQWYPKDRPSMKAVVQMLEGDGKGLSAPPNPNSSTNLGGKRGGLDGRLFNGELEVISEFDDRECKK